VKSATLTPRVVQFVPKEALRAFMNAHPNAELEIVACCSAIGLLANPPPAYIDHAMTVRNAIGTMMALNTKTHRTFSPVIRRNGN